MPNKRDRITIAGTLYHQIVGSNPTSVSLACTQHILSEEQVYARNPSKGIGPNWELLKFRWAKKCSVFSIRNNETADPEEAKDWEEKKLILGCASEEQPDPDIVVSSFLCVPPEMVSLLYPSSDGIQFAIKSGGADSVKYSLFVIPR